MSPRLLAWAGVGLALAAGWGLAGWQSLRLAWLQQEVADERAAAAEVAQLRERAAAQLFRAQAGELQGVADAKDRELRRVRDDLGAALDGLRDRTARADAAASAAAGTCAGATGAQLSGEDAAFLAREAARADELRAELGACQQRERAIREHLSPAP